MDDADVKISVGDRLYAAIIEKYGPIAFGLFVLLVVWKLVVAPELKSQRIDFEANQAIVTQMGEIANTMQVTARSLERAIEIMDRNRE